MESPSNDEAFNLETEYTRIKTILYKKLFLYIALLTLVIITIEVIRAIIYEKIGILIVSSIFLIFGTLFISFIWRLKRTQELSITIFFIIFFLSTLLAQFYAKTGYFDLPIDTFNFAYAFAICERIIISRISKFFHRTLFIVSITLVRSFVIYPSDQGLFVMQYVYLFFTIYLDFDRENYDHEFFLTYFRNKDQLLKFKNLVVQDIPESIVIVTRNLKRCLFVNNSFQELKGFDSNLDIRAHINQFIVQDNLQINQEQNKDNLSSCEKKTLLTFLEQTFNPQNNMPHDKKFSCNLKFSKFKAEDDPSQPQIREEYIFEAKAIPLEWDEQPGIAIVLHDITQQHTVLSLKIADANKDSILATISHELRTPLNSILGVVQIMEKSIKDKELLHYLEICKNSGNLLLSLVNSILDLNQIRAKKFKLCPERIDLFKLLKDIVNLFLFQCTQKGIFIKLNISPDTPNYILTDQNRLSQILINLIGNAIKFTREGGLTISTCKCPFNEEYITFSVEDTGCGIKDEDQKKLFQVFGKLEQSNRNVNPHGVGLGLTISDKLVRLLGPNNKEGIYLESQYSKGSRFTFSIKKKIEVLPSERDLDPFEKYFDEKGDVHKKMKSYSKCFVKDCQKSESLARTGISFDSSDNSIRKTFYTQIPKSPMDSLSLVNNNDRSLPSLKLTSGQILSTTQTITPYVLIVDDNPLNNMIAEHLVSSQGYKSKTALYSQVAIDIILTCDYSSEPIKLVLMDCQMPIMDGYTTTKILRKMMQEKKIPEIPIVALTANDTEIDREASRRAGMCEHIVKPLKESELARILRKYMNL